MRPTTLHVTTGLLTASALYVGPWAALAPRSFYDSFPGFHRVWVGVDGPFNEHLVRDVGGLYLALAVAGVIALCRLDATALLVLGGAWTVFDLTHLVYHLHHLAELAALDAVGNVVALGGTLVLALHLLVHGLQRSVVSAGE
ncbi:hypothetical protein [Nocardioides sp. SYSU D00038]|uniref:hypothetical protein n=1 Tax=Nocardioides sp. SYSU D00038 TaxID=2812554 RepID=UPI001968250D|nr:hypothetical protein [Nocardioides sp. SYSU D00038]